MKIKLHSNYASPKGSGRPGDVIEVDKDTAKALIADGYASKPGDDRPRKTPSVAKADQPSSGSDNDNTGLEVPAGSAKEVNAWIGEDAERAAAALAAEEVAKRPRKSVLAHANSVIGGQE